MTSSGPLRRELDVATMLLDDVREAEVLVDDTHLDFLIVRIERSIWDEVKDWPEVLEAARLRRLSTDVR